MPDQVSIFCVVVVPQVLREWVVQKLSDAQWFWRATRVRQSSTRSLFAPATTGWVEVSTKVPSVQPVADRRGSGVWVEAGDEEKATMTVAAARAAARVATAVFLSSS